MSHPALAANVKVARPVSFLPPPPILFTYDQGLGSVDISDLFHRAFTVGMHVTHSKKQERGRLRAVVDYARKLLSSNDADLQNIARRLNVPPVSVSSEKWTEWSDEHRHACAELKKAVEDSFAVEGKLTSTSVSSVGSRLCKRK